MKVKQYTRSALALLLILASLVSMIPAVFATEEEERQQITIHADDLADSLYGSEDKNYTILLDDEAPDEDYEQSIVNALMEEYGLDVGEQEDSEFGYLTDEECEELGIETDPATRDVRNETNFAYIFLDFKVGSASRSFNWQVKSGVSTNQYFAANPQGLLACYFKGDNCNELYMPIETRNNSDTDYLHARLKDYTIKSGDIAQVRIYETTANGQIVKDNTATHSSYLAVRTSDNPSGWKKFGANAKFKLNPAGQTLQWNVFNGTNNTDKENRVGDTLYGIRWDPSQSELTESTRIYVDYIYIGPPSTAPCKVTFRTEGDKGNFSMGAGYVGHGKKAPAWSTGQPNSQSSDGLTKTIWGWAVHEDKEKDGTYVNLHKFITDPSTYTVKYDTKFVLTKVTVRVEDPKSNHTFTTGQDPDDNKYLFTVDGFNTANVTLGSYGTPLDVSFIIDRSGSQDELVGNIQSCTTWEHVESKLNNLSKAVPAGYYRAECFRRNKNRDAGDPGFAGFKYTMPMRYYRGEWQMQTLVDCNCNKDSAGYQYDWSYGIYNDPTHKTMKYCKHVKWVSMKEGFEDFVDDAANTVLLAYHPSGYTMGKSYTINGTSEKLVFRFGASRLGRTQDAIVNFYQKLFNSTPNLKPGESHTVSVLGYGYTVCLDGYPFKDTGGTYRTTNNYSACSRASEALSVVNYEAILKAIRDPYCIGPTRTDCAFQVLSGTLSSIEKDAGKTATTVASTSYLPAAKTGRQRVVILVTDGVPSSNLAFNATVANRAVNASEKLKNNANTKVYAIGVMDNLDASRDTLYSKQKQVKNASTGQMEDETAAQVAARYSEAKLANDFLNTISSRYRDAKTFYHPVSSTYALTKGNFYRSDYKDASEIATQVSGVWNDTAPKVANSELSGPSSLWFYEKFTREWRPDTEEYLNIYAQPYTGNGTYGGRVLIGRHLMTDVISKSVTAGNGYNVHYAFLQDQGIFEFKLQWTDTTKSFLRETEVDFGSAAKAVSGTLNTKKGYKILMEIPVVINENDSLGGNNIPMISKESGCYTSDSSGKTMADLVYGYTVYDANVACPISANGQDYYLSAEEYIALLQQEDTKVSAKELVENVLKLQFPRELSPVNQYGESNLEYISFDVKLTDDEGNVLYHKAADQGAMEFKNNQYSLDEYDIDLLKDHEFTMVVNMDYVTNDEDSFERAAYPDVNQTYRLCYYVPKFAVVDYGDDISIPMDLEGLAMSALPADQVTFSDGMTYDAETNTMKYSFANADPMCDRATVSYTLPTYSKPLGTEKYTTTTDAAGNTLYLIEREVVVIPGNQVSHDDVIVEYANEDMWQVDGEGADLEQVLDHFQIHGGDETYHSDKDFHGSVRFAEVDSNNISQEAYFRFRGTGFEVLSRTSPDSGVILVEVFKGNVSEFTADDLLKSILCNTYSANGEYYQVPVIRWEGEERGDYTIRLTAYYHPIFALRSARNAVTEEQVREILGYDDSVDFTYIPPNSYSAKREIATSYRSYIDGIRVYGAAENNEETAMYYSFAGESYSTYLDMYNVILDTENWNGQDADGMLYIAGTGSQVGSGDATVGTSQQGFPLLMDGAIRNETVTVVGRTGKEEKRIYFLDKDGNRYTHPDTGREFWSMVSDDGRYRYYMDNSNISSGEYVPAARVGDTYYALPKIPAVGELVSATVIPVTGGYVTKENASIYAFQVTTDGRTMLLSNGNTKAASWTYGVGRNGTYSLRLNGTDYALIFDQSALGFKLVPTNTVTDSDLDPEFVPVQGTNYSHYVTMSRYIVKDILGSDAIFYNSAYKCYGPKAEVQLQQGSGVAFNVAGEKVHLGLKSAGGSCHVQVWNGSGWEDYRDPKGQVSLNNVVSATEMFYDFSHYGAQGTLMIKNIGEGILSIVHIKTPVEDSGIGVTKSMAIEAAKAFETPVDRIETSDLKLSHSLNLQSNIGINYIVPKENLADYDYYSFTAEVNGETYELKGEEKGEYVYFTLDVLTAAQMNDIVRGELVGYKGEEIFVSPLDHYSIATYAFTMINMEGVSEQLKSLCANLLRYGSATQMYLDYTDNGLADEELTAEQRAYLRDLDAVEFGDHYSVLSDIADPAVTWYGKTLALDSTVAVKLVVDASDYMGDASRLELLVSYTGIDGEEKSLSIAPTVYNGEKNLYLFTIDTLDAAELRSVLTCRVMADGEAVSRTMTYSADSYGNGKTGALLELCKALFAYVDEAKALFEN